MLKKYCLTTIVCAGMAISFAQQTQSYADKAAAYKNGLELFDEKNYASAREKFEVIYKQQPIANGHTDEVMMQNLEYYIAVSAAEGNDKDAEALLLNYTRKYHETDKRRLVGFYLGKYYYRNKRYSDAVEFFTKVNVNDLSNEQIYEYRFQLGYSYFTKKKFTEAKPLFASIKDIQDKYFYPANYYYAFICFYNKEYEAALKIFTSIEDSKMYSSVIPYYVAQIHFMKKDYDKLIPYLDKTLQRTDVKYKEEMKFLLGKAYYEKGEYAKALPLLNDYITKQGKSSKEDIYELGYAQYMTGEYAKAIENFKQIYSLDEKIGQNASYAMADCYLKLKKLPEARTAFQNAASKGFDESIQQNALFNYGKLSFELGYSSEAIQTLQTYQEKYPNGIYNDEVNELLAAVLVQTKNYEKAYHIMENMKMGSQLIKEAYQKVTYFRAIELYNDHKTDEALVLCDKSLTYPMNVDIQALAIYLKAEIQYLEEQYTPAAQNYLKFAQLTNPALETKGNASKFRAYYNIGYCHFKNKKYTDATTYFSNAISEAENTTDSKGKAALMPDLYQRYGDCAFVAKDYNKAVEAYTKIVNSKWNAADYAQYRKGIILGLQNQPDAKVEAMNYLLSAFAGSNYADEAYYEIGETYLDAENYSPARVAYQNVISKYPNSPLLPGSYMKLAVIDYKSGKKDQAADDYKTVVTQYPQSQEAKEAMDALKDLYVEMGKPDAYFDFAKGKSNVTISSSEQDSLTYQSAERYYNEGDCQRAITLYGNYVTKFPNGLFAGEAHWKKAECHLKAKEYPAANTDLEAVIENKYGKYYERALLKASGIAFYELKDYNKALSDYKQLYAASTNAQNTYTAMLGILRASVKLNNHAETIEYADQLLNSGVAKDIDIQEAYYEKAKAYYSKGDKDFALSAFNRVTELPVSEKAVESKYMVAKILFDKQDYKGSMDTCFKINKKYSSYEYWLAKTFVLLADNYNAMGNTFQAKATLQSIIDNYEGDKALVEEAKQKLAQMKGEEMNKSKVLPPAPTDSLIMEPDNLIKD